MNSITGPYKPHNQPSTLKAILSAEAHELLTWTIVGTITALCAWTILAVSNALVGGL